MGKSWDTNLLPHRKGEEMSINEVLGFASSPKSIEAWKIGMRRVNKIVQQERQAGFRAMPTGMYSDGADILVFLGDQLVRVYEVTNYKSPDFYIQLDRAVRYRDNLLESEGHKIFVCSYEENLKYLPGVKDFFEQHGIEVRVMGYQD